MTLEEQVTSLELSKKLKALGVKQESLFWWRHNWSKQKYELQTNPEGYPAYTVAELGEILPANVVRLVDGMEWGLESLKVGDIWEVVYSDFMDVDNGGFHDLPTVKDKSEANARAKMLIYLIENKLV